MSREKRMLMEPIVRLTLPLEREVWIFWVSSSRSEGEIMAADPEVQGVEKGATRQRPTETRSYVRKRW